MGIEAQFCISGYGSGSALRKTAGSGFVRNEYGSTQPWYTECNSLDQLDALAPLQ